MGADKVDVGCGSVAGFGSDLEVVTFLLMMSAMPPPRG